MPPLRVTWKKGGWCIVFCHTLQFTSALHLTASEEQMTTFLLIMEKVFLLSYLFSLKLKNMERHYEPKLSFQEHANTREQRLQPTFRLQKYIFSILRGGQLPEPWIIFHIPLNIFSVKLSDVFRNGFWNSPVSNSHSQQKLTSHSLSLLTGLNHNKTLNGKRQGKNKKTGPNSKTFECTVTSCIFNGNDLAQQC